ncbi:hypothetical protein [Kribbella sp. NPDC048928]|uniref:hypothetical protein n=1 Tax=Kribbella sp. NPDC048928 TaxID=3364111 RepID=UPI003718C8DF
MSVQNGRLVALVAAVAVAAITGGGALASRQGPADANGSATPLSTSPSTAPSTPAPTTTTAKPTPTKVPPSTTPTGLVKTKIVLKNLTQGRAPQITYLAGRTIRGGAGEDVKVPGTAQIQAVARLGGSSFAVVTKKFGTELLTLNNVTGEVTRRTPDVTQIVTTDNGSAAAYIATHVKETGEETAGATVYAEEANSDVWPRTITVPGVWNARIHGYFDGTVYFDAAPTQSGATVLYRWKPGEPKAIAIKSIPNALAMSSAGTAGSLTTLSDQNSCSSLLAVPAGTRLWRTCDYMITGFTPDAATVIAGPKYQDGYGDGIAAVLDAKNGAPLHEWSGVFRQAIPEDDQHLLLLADDGEQTPASIIRCTISSGACELATPLAKGDLRIGA